MTCGVVVVEIGPRIKSRKVYESSLNYYFIYLECYPLLYIEGHQKSLTLPVERLCVYMVKKTTCEIFSRDSHPAHNKVAAVPWPITKCLLCGVKRIVINFCGLLLLVPTVLFPVPHSVPSAISACTSAIHDNGNQLTIGIQRCSELFNASTHCSIESATAEM